MVCQSRANTDQRQIRSVACVADGGIIQVVYYRFVTNALRTAHYRRKPTPGALHHSMAIISAPVVPRQLYCSGNHQVHFGVEDNFRFWHRRPLQHP